MKNEKVLVAIDKGNGVIEYEETTFEELFSLKPGIKMTLRKKEAKFIVDFENYLIKQLTSNEDLKDVVVYSSYPAAKESLLETLNDELSSLRDIQQIQEQELNLTLKNIEKITEIKLKYETLEK